MQATATTPNHTMQPVKVSTVDEVVKREFVKLHRSAMERKKQNPSGDVYAYELELVFGSFKYGLKEADITIQQAIDCYRAYYKSGKVSSGAIQSLGWLLAYAFERESESIKAEFCLDPTQNPIIDNANPAHWSQDTGWPPQVPENPGPVEPSRGLYYPPEMVQRQNQQDEQQRQHMVLRDPAPPPLAARPASTELAKSDGSEVYTWIVDLEQQATPRALLDQPYALLTHCEENTFIEQMGVPTCHMLVIADRVTDLPVVCNTIHALMNQALNEKACNPEAKGPQINIIDLSGDRYLGYKYLPGVVYHPDSLLPRGKIPLLNGEVRRPDPALDATQAVLEFVPLLEGMYQARKVLNNRLSRKQRTSSKEAFPQFHRYIYVLRWWNVILRRWNKLGKKGQDQARDIWCDRYNRQNDGITPIDVLLDFMSMGDTVNCQLLVTTKTISSVKQLGLDEDDLGSFMPVVPGDGNATTGFGFAGINRILGDKRWDFNNFDGLYIPLAWQQRRLRALVKLAISYSEQSGHQAVFVGTQMPQIMPLASFYDSSGEIIRIEDVDSDEIKARYEHIGSVL